MITDRQLRNEVRVASVEAGSQQDYARVIGVHPVVLSSFMSGARRPSKSLLAALGYEKITEVGYRRKGE